MTKSIVYTNSMAIVYDKKYFKSMRQARRILKQNGFVLTQKLWSTVDLTMNILNFREYHKGSIRVLLVERLGGANNGI